MENVNLKLRQRTEGTQPRPLHVVRKCSIVSQVFSTRKTSELGHILHLIHLLPSHLHGLLCMYTSCRFTLQLRLTSPRIIRYNYNMTDVVYRQGYLMQPTAFDHRSQHQLGQLGPIISFNAILEIRCTLYGGRSVLHAGQHLHDSFLFFR